MAQFTLDWGGPWAQHQYDVAIVTGESTCVPERSLPWSSWTRAKPFIKGQSVLQTERQEGRRKCKEAVQRATSWGNVSLGEVVDSMPGSPESCLTQGLYFPCSVSCSVSLRPLFTQWMCGRTVSSQKCLSLRKDPGPTPSSPMGNVLCLFQERSLHFLSLGCTVYFSSSFGHSMKKDTPSSKKFSSPAKCFPISSEFGNEATSWLCTDLPRASHSWISSLEVKLG